jgi:hypothetical protein
MGIEPTHQLVTGALVLKTRRPTRTLALPYCYNVCDIATIVNVTNFCSLPYSEVIFHLPSVFHAPSAMPCNAFVIDSLNGSLCLCAISCVRRAVVSLTRP